ncbi:predicted protein [Histoplasma mississippiense (nom. inval.)]|nr:predicted protein [Histoplasma mississippiense (nom. inval.)]EDN06981.1 predicted protein [Histoplasma mississippiense (nom. inval.)]
MALNTDIATQTLIVALKSSYNEKFCADIALELNEKSFNIALNIIIKIEL